MAEEHSIRTDVSARRGRRARGDAGPGAARGMSPSLVVSGGKFEPLAPSDLARMHEAVIAILATIGLAEAPPQAVALVVDAGGRVADDGRLLFPRPLVERTLAGLPRRLELHGRQAGREIELAGKRVHVGSGGAAPYVVDLQSGAYRPSTLRDLHDAARLVDALEHIQFFSRSLVARDLPDALSLDLNTAFASLAGTTKHVAVSASAPAHVTKIGELCFAIAGSAEAFRARPFLSLNVNHVVPPLRFSADAVGVLIEAVRLGIPVHVNSFGQLGASSPVTIAGSVAQTIAETVAGMVLAYLVDPSAKVVFGPRPMVTDLRTGAMAGGSGEQALLTATAVQMAQHYGLPNSTIAGASDSKLADAQSGYEKCLSISLAAHAGCNMITQAGGMQAGLMGCSFESYVIDNDMLGAILRSLAPIEVGDTTLAVEAIGEVVRDQGHFLGHPETFRRMHSDFLYPQVADRRTHEAWTSAGAPDVRSVANARAKDILSRHAPRHIDARLWDELTARFGLHLPRA